ncbi:unnamed protein product [Chrysoparadoxa australica]
MRKMKIGIFEGQMKRLFHPYHADMNPATMEELSEKILIDLIESVTMRVDKTGNEKATGAALGARSTVATVDRQAQRGFLPTGTGADTTQKCAGAEVAFEDPAALKDAIGAVRDDANSDDWCLFGYKNSKVIGKVGQGTGGLKALLAACQDGVVNYGLFRVNEQKDMTANVRFCFICWQPEDLPPTAKARFSTHKGAVTKAFREHQSYHYDFRVSTRDELTDEKVADHIGYFSGTKTKFGDASLADKMNKVAVKTEQRSFLGGVSNSTESLSFVNEEELRAALAKVRNDASPDDFCVAGFDGHKLALKKVGTGGLAAAVAELPADNFAYALVRTTEQIDNSVTVKFFYVKWNPSAIPASVKGKLGVLQGAVTKVFEPYHGDLVTGDSVDLTEANMMSRVANLRAHNI